MSEKYKNLKVKDLQELLQKNGLPHTGKKEELIERLVQHDEKVEKELISLEEEFGNLEDYKGDANPEELTTDIAKESKEKSEEAKKEDKTNALVDSDKKEDKKATEEKPKSNFKFTPITFDKAPSASSTQKPVIPVVPQKAVSSDAEKAIERAKRFGVQLNDSAKKDLRAQRFGVPKKVNNEEALKKRAERFGLNKGGNDPEILKKRAEKFGTNKGGIDPEVLKKRAERFGLNNGNKVPVKFDAAEEEKKRKRAERFSENDAKKQKTG
ncbi:hypothetical protein G6F46_002751 [Rhizopus delemar]|uniref:SAP domain-containing protein n=3 Tax=Rhizopus TaxID=4842 RepID=I1BNW4_RHIO9|nr:hypothetical protein RO3G_02598 [Rhizopus delemar RA 99-880]KAG1467018.1 hypothetical protein G6F55_000095 [Rhizopus delemar]KAG1549731.1 hypothetical protein G6F51_002875 [Rhizopus arrhizus]KAG1502490.1 hypothetical protein G6F54_002322 [Rhizopus delemar]KAG1516119.1 hypothetical protein G6F53_002399 [Rhizopus delemar]|eukprot:EIE77894.1 hypothetical protein RO3G_02598 [Rhizopus delemar RA 99-880]